MAGPGAPCRDNVTWGYDKLTFISFGLGRLDKISLDLFTLGQVGLRYLKLEHSRLGLVC